MLLKVQLLDTDLVQVLEQAVQAAGQDCTLLRTLCGAHAQLAELCAAAAQPVATELGLQPGQAQASARACQQLALQRCS